MQAEVTYYVYNNVTHLIVDFFDSMKDAELWIAEQEHSNNYEIVKGGE